MKVRFDHFRRTVRAVHPAAVPALVRVLDRVLAADHVRALDLAGIRVLDLDVLAAIASRVLVPDPSRAIRAKTRDQRAAPDRALDGLTIFIIIHKS